MNDLPKDRSWVVGTLCLVYIQTDIAISETPPKYISHHVAWDHKIWYRNSDTGEDDPWISTSLWIVFSHCKNSFLMLTGTCSCLLISMQNLPHLPKRQKVGFAFPSFVQTSYDLIFNENIGRPSSPYLSFLIHRPPSYLFHSAHSPFIWVSTLTPLPCPISPFFSPPFCLLDIPIWTKEISCPIV